MLHRLFFDHPTSVGETYGEHFQFASSVGWTMLAGGAAAFVHALIPALCETTASRAIARLNHRLVEHRRRKGLAADPMLNNWVI